MEPHCPVVMPWDYEIGVPERCVVSLELCTFCKSFSPAEHARVLVLVLVKHEN